MEIREIDAAAITATVKKLFMDCNYFIGADIMRSLESALTSAGLFWEREENYIESEHCFEIVYEVTI